MDNHLQDDFSPVALREAFRIYKSRKTDFFDQDKIRISMGADGVTFEAFDSELDRNVNFISRKVLAGKYLFYPFREIEVDKPGGGKRTLSIASIRDVLVQMQLYKTVYGQFEQLFRRASVNRVSFAYRKGFSAPKAALQLQRYIQAGYTYALDADIVKYFDRIPHDQLLIRVGEVVGSDTLAYKLIYRFIHTDRVAYASYRRKRVRRLAGKEIFRKVKPERCRRIAGVPQGGILSGMLANLYLHSFDRWVMEVLTETLDLRYIRYADDFIILVKDGAVLESLRDKVAAKLDEMRLELHTDIKKTKLVDVSKDGLDFVGFHVTATAIGVRQATIDKFKDGICDRLRRESKWNFEHHDVGRKLRVLIANRLNMRIRGRPDEICPRCGGPLDDKPKSWVGFFSIVTDVNQLQELDDWIRAEIAIYFLMRFGHHVKRKDLKRARLASIEREYYNVFKRKPCRCPDLTSEPFPEDEWERFEYFF